MVRLTSFLLYSFIIHLFQFLISILTVLLLWYTALSGRDGVGSSFDLVYPCRPLYVVNLDSTHLMSVDVASPVPRVRDRSVEDLLECQEHVLTASGVSGSAVSLYT